MENPSSFELDGAIARWREDLAQFPHFRPENAEELETHLRDSIRQLRQGGLSDEEAFLIARSRVGKPERIEAEFAKVNRNPSNKIAHCLVFLFFCTGCFFLWGTLMLPRMMRGALDARPLPAFTSFCMNLKWIFYVLPIAASVYVTFVCLRRTRSRDSWVGFLAVSAAVLILFALQIGIAVMLPVIDYMQRS